MTPEDRRRYLEHARDLFNRGEYWLAHEALETVWRSIIRQDEARAVQAAGDRERRGGTRLGGGRGIALASKHGSFAFAHHGRPGQSAFLHGCDLRVRWPVRLGYPEA